MYVKRALSAATAVSLACLSLPALSASAQAAVPAARPASVPAATHAASSATTKEGSQTTVTGKVPSQYKNSLVILEVTDGRTRQEMGMTVADKAGNVNMAVTFGGDGIHQAQWRVIKDKKTKWTSGKFTINLTDAGKKHAALADAYDVFSHNLPNKTPANTIKPGKKPSESATKRQVTRAGVTITPRGLGAPNEGAPVAEDATEHAAESTEKSAGQMVGDFGKSLATNIGWDFVADGVTSLFGVIFSGQAAATAQQVAQLTQDVQQGFATVESQLNTIEADLSQLSQQVSTIQNEVVQANSSAAAANCNTLLSEANAYVGRIQNVYGDYETTLDPQWVEANLLGQNPQQGLKVLGSTIYGQGAGTPPFSSGVVSLQNSVSGLGALMSANGPASSGVIASCASAVSAGIASNYSAAQQQAGLSENQSVIAAGAVEQSYYDSMHSIVAYYTGWLSIGQDLASRGGQMGAALLAGGSVTSAADVNALCVGAAASAASSVISCPGVVFNTQNTINQINAAWIITGASWYDVSNGSLVGDARAGSNSGYMTPAQHAWVQDIAMYGASVEGLQGPSEVVTQTAQIQNPLPACYIDGGTGSCLNFTPTFSNGILTSGPLTVPWSDWSSFASAGYILNSSGTVVTWQGAAAPAQDITVFSNNLSSLPDGTYTAVYQVSGCGMRAVPSPSNSSSASCNLYTQQFGVTLDSSSTDTYYNPTGPLSSTGGAASVPAAGSTALTTTTWLGIPFAPATTANWQYLLPTQNCSTSANCVAGQSTGQLMYAGGLSNGGATPANLIVYTGESSQFSVSANTSFDDAPNTNNSSISNSNANTFSDYTTTSYSFLDASTNLSPGYNPVIGAPSTPVGGILTAAWPMGNEWATNGGNNQLCDVKGSGGTGTCKGNNNYTNYMSVNNSGGSFSPPNGATSNSSFYAPLTQYNAFSVDLSIGSDSSKADYSNQSDTLTGVPAFMTYQGLNSSAMSQYLWPVLNLTGGAAPCAMTAFSQGYDGQAGVGNVCQGMYQEWMAGALGVTTGPVSISAGGIQGTLTEAGNNVLQALIINNSSSAANVTVYADVTSGDAEVGSIVNAGSSSGVDVNGVSISNCSTNNNALQCSMSVQPGNTIINIPVTGANGAASYSSGEFVLGLAGTGMYSSSTTSITPTTTAGTETVPGAVTNLTASASSQSTNSAQYVTASWMVPSANPEVSGYQFQITDPTGNVTTQSTSGSNGVNVTSGSSGTSGGSSQAQATIQLPSTQSGVWTIQVAPVNPAGTGPYASASAALGDSAPAVPSGFTATEAASGAITLTWNPVSANPALSNYSVSITSPSVGGIAGATTTVVANSPTYTIQNVNLAGTWSFSLTAVNSLGASNAATTFISVAGSVPQAVSNLTTSVSGDGLFSVTWNGAAATPVPSSYNLAIYGPGATGLAILTQDFATSSANSTFSALDVVQLGQDSVPGTYTVVVSASNSVGIGPSTQSAVYISQAKINHSTLDRLNSQILGSLPASFHALAAAQCQAGLWQSGFNVFGTCDEVNRIFTSSTGLPAGPQMGPLPTQQVPSDTTKVTEGAGAGVGAANGTYTGSYRRGKQKVAWTLSQDNGGQCIRISTGAATLDPFCPKVTNVTVDSSGNWRVGVKNRSVGNTSITWHNTFRGVVDSIVSTTAPLVDGSGGVVTSNVVNTWINPQPGQTGTWDMSYSVNGADYKMTGNIQVVISNL